jgi:signal transduction histidine kinase
MAWDTGSAFQTEATSMKLFTRFNRISLFAMVLVFLLSGILYYVLLSGVLIHELDEALIEYRARLDNYIIQHNRLPDFNNNFDEVEVRYHLVDKACKSELSSVRRYDKEEEKYGRFRQLVFTGNVNSHLYEINIAKPVEGTKLVTKTIALITLLLLLLIIIVSIILNRIILRKLWQPFYHTIDELKGFKLSNKKTPEFPVTDIEEFSFMNQSLTKVIDDANDEYKTLKEFTENASHELQTPLAIIRSKLDLVIQEEGLSESQSNALNSAYKGIHRLTKLNQSLLLLAKIENLQFSTTEEVELKEKIEDKLQQFHEFWAGNNIRVSAMLQPEVITANAELIDILLNNLLSNAGRHNKSGGEIVITLRPGRLSVSNTATGQELDKSKVFDRFYKQASGSQNNGLGLSIVKQICERSGISIRYSFDDYRHSFVLMW